MKKRSIVTNISYFIIIACVLTGIKKYIVGLIIKTSSEASSLEKEKTYLGKLNMILVQVSNFNCFNNMQYKFIHI